MTFNVIIKRKIDFFIYIKKKNKCTKEAKEMGIKGLYYKPYK